MKRIALFLATNLAIVLVLSVTMRLLGVEPYLNANGLNLTSLLIFAAVMGFGGSFISLAISKWSVKKSMGVHVIRSGSGCLNSIPRFISGLWADCRRCRVVHGGVRRLRRTQSRGGQLGAHRDLHLTRPASTAAVRPSTFHPG